MVPAGMINFQATPLEQVLLIYAEFVNRTLLRASALPAATITLKTQTQLSKREVIQALDTVLGMNGITMITIGEKFVKAVPVGQANQEAAPFSNQDATQLAEFGSYVTHVVQLKYARPSELVQVLQPFSKIPNSIQPIDSSQILVLRDYTENVKRMLELIAQIDVSIPSEYVSEVIPIKYALASDISSALNSLSSGGGGATVGSSGASRTGSMGTSRATGIGTGVGQPGSATYPGGINNRQGMTPGANPGGTAPGGAGGGNFSDRLRSIIQKASVTGEFQVLGQTKIIADERINALLVYASQSDMQTIKDIVSKLDVVLAQVLIEAIIMEVSLDNSRSIGVSAAQNPKSFFGHPNIVGGGGFNNGQSFLGGSGSNSIGSLTSLLPSLPSGAGNSFSYFGNVGPNFDVAIQAAASDSRINVLSRPRIQTSHGVEADLFVGQTVPYINGTTFGDYAGIGARSSYQEKQIGITLRVKPLINPDGLVVMDISQDIGQRGPDVLIDKNPVPIINQRTAQATVAVKDRDTIILGGMISTTKSKTKSGVPFLKDIPILGTLFRSTSDSGQRVELIVLLRPTVLPTPEAAAVVATAERRNLPGVRRAEAEIQEEEAARMKQTEKELDHKTDKPLTTNH
jgi:general secretion pathway protein D